MKSHKKASKSLKLLDAFFQSYSCVSGGICCAGTSCRGCVDCCCTFALAQLHRLAAPHFPLQQDLD